MKKIFIFLLLTFFIQMPVLAFQDCLLFSDGKLTDIKIEHNDIIDVYPLITIMNEKNILFIQPLKLGETKFSVLKNKKTKHIFEVSVTNEETKISSVKGFESIVLDVPEFDEESYYEDILDLPPGVVE